MGNDVDLSRARLSLVTMRTREKHRAPDAGTDRIDVAVVGPDSDLRAMSRLARARFDLDDTVGDLRHFQLKKPLNQTWMTARDDDLRAFGRLAHLDDVRLEPSSVFIALVRDLLGRGSRASTFPRSSKV